MILVLTFLHKVIRDHRLPSREASRPKRSVSANVLFSSSVTEIQLHIISLYINDYNLDSPNAKSRGMVALVKRINANSRIIEAVGTQMHLQANAYSGVQSVLELLATTGLPVAITELDIVNAGSNDYVAVAKACLAVSACVGITSWGVSDAVSRFPFLAEAQV